MILRVVIILFLFVNELSAVNKLDSVFNNSNELYNSNMFQDALDGYVSLLDQDISNKVLYYNIGNCYYKLDKLGYARVSYEKAKLYDPSDKDILHNLQVVESKLIDEIIAIPEFFIINIVKEINSIFSASQWGYVFLFALYLNVLLVILFLFSFSLEMKVNILRSLFLSVIFFLITTFFLFYSNSSDKYMDGVLVDDNTYVKTAPSLSSSDYFIIHEGLKFQIIDTVDDWSRILLTDGKDGWIKNSTFQKIEI
tara:strand:+ start:200 stop:958 length:759 start_codon:yes stop_codon:yes gene_type:complete